MTETISVFFFSLRLHRSFLYLKKRRAFDLILVQVLSILLIGFRMSYLAFVVVLSVALPVLPFVRVVVANRTRRLLIPRRWPVRISHKLQKFMAPVLFMVAAMKGP